MNRLHSELAWAVTLCLLLSACAQPPTQTGQASITAENAGAAPTTEVNEKSGPLPTPTAPPVSTGATPTPSATPERGAPASPRIEAADLDSLAPARSLQQEGPLDLAWAAGGQILAAAGAEEITLYAIGPVNRVFAVPAATPANLTASPAEARLAWSESGGAVHVWDVQAAVELAAFEAGPGEVTGLAFSPDGALLAASTFDRRLLIWDIATRESIRTWDLPAFLVGLSFSPDGARLAGIDMQTFTAHLFSLETQEEVQTLAWSAHASPVLYSAEFSPDWSRLAWVARGAVQLMDTASGDFGPSLEHEDAVNGLAWSPDSLLIATLSAGEVEGGFSPLVTFWDAATGEILRKVPFDEPPIALEFSPGGGELAFLFGSGEIQVWTISP